MKLYALFKDLKNNPKWWKDPRVVLLCWLPIMIVVSTVIATYGMIYLGEIMSR